jgi:hypothetical protein
LAKAREAAAEARRKRAEFKNQLHDGELTLADALDAAAEDETLAHIRVSALLKSLPRVGEKRAQQALDKLGIAQNRRIRGLGKHQITALKAEFK